jgi:hypothetical protein
VIEHPEYELLDGYLLGTLTESDAQRVRAHLAECGACRAELAELQAVLDVLPHALPDLKPSVRARERIFERIDTAKRAARPRFSASFLALAAALALAVGLDLWLAAALARARDSHGPAVASVTPLPRPSRLAPARPAPLPTPRPVAARTSAPATPAPSATPAREDAALRARVAALEASLLRERARAGRDGARDRDRIAHLERRLAEAEARVVALSRPAAATPAPAAGPTSPAPSATVPPELVTALSTGRVYSVDGVVGSEPWHLTIVQPPAGKDARIFTRTPDAPDGDTYRTWVLRGSQTFDAGELRPATQTELEMPMPLQAGDQVAFSREPVGTGNRPTSPFLMKVVIGP